MKSSHFVILILILFAILTPTSAQTTTLIDETKTLYNQGTKFYAEGKYNEAIEAFNQFIHLKPDSASAYNNLGVAHSDFWGFI